MSVTFFSTPNGARCFVRSLRSITNSRCCFSSDSFLLRWAHVGPLQIHFLTCKTKAINHHSKISALFLSLQCIYIPTINQTHPPGRPTNQTLARSSSLTQAASKHHPLLIHAAIAPLDSTDSCRTPPPFVCERWCSSPPSTSTRPICPGLRCRPESDDEDKAYAPAASMGGSSTTSTSWREEQRGPGGVRGW